MSLALTDEQRQIVRNILATYLPAGTSACAFGSRVKNANRALSDLDIAVKAREPLTLSQLGDLTEAFSESDLPFRVDVVDWRSASAFMQAIIDRDGVEL
jgi:predicted nucleotidyltransferase